MKYFLLLLSCISFSSAFSSLQAQITFTNYTTSDGLVDNNINCIHIDTADRVWLGTQNGIAMFDGSTWTTYTQATHSNLVNDNITAIFVASDDRLWVGSDFGLSVLNDTTFTTYTNVDGLGNNRIKHINEDANGIIWVGEFSGATKYDGTTFTKYGSSDGLPFGGVNHITFDAQNNVWMGSGLGGLIKYDGSNFTIINASNGLKHNVVRSITVDPLENKWVATAEGISVVNDTGAIIATHTRMLTLPAPDTLNPMEDIDIDSKGNIWAAIYVDYLVTEGGIAMYDGSQWIDYDVSDGLIGPVVRELAIDKSDNVWVATSSGLSKISNIPNAITSLENTAPTFSIFPNPVSSDLFVQIETDYQNTKHNIEIYSTSMQQLATFVVDGSDEQFSIPMKEWTNGLYFIRVNNEMRKFVLQR